MRHRARSLVTMMVPAMLLGLAFATSALAQEIEVPVSIHVPILMKVITFDRQLRARANHELVIGVAFQSGNRKSVATKDEVVKLLQATRLEVEGLGVRVVAIDLDNERLADILDDGTMTHLYLTPLHAVDIRVIVNQTRAAHVVSMSSVPAHVGDGVALGVALRGGRSRVLVNLEGARKEGADLSAELLKLSEIVK